MLIGAGNPDPSQINSACQLPWEADSLTVECCQSTFVRKGRRQDWQRKMLKTMWYTTRLSLRQKAGLLDALFEYIKWRGLAKSLYPHFLQSSARGCPLEAGTNMGDTALSTEKKSSTLQPPAETCHLLNMPGANMVSSLLLL